MALKAGTAIVTLTTSEGLSTTVTVTVTKKPDPIPNPIPNPNPGLTLISAPEATITVGKSIVLMYSFIPDFDGDDLSVHTTADKDDVVQIFEGSTITVKALAAGKVTLTLSAANGKYTATAIINVVEASE